MSATATGWVFDKSPYKGSLFTLHLAIADIVNDTHGNELWTSVDTLSAKSRLSERSVRSGLGQMVRDGLLELRDAPEGKPRRYRFLMPANPCTSCTPAHLAPLQPDAPTPAKQRQTPANERETPATVAPYPKRTQENSTGSQDLARDLESARRRDDGFARFWDAYPRKRSKGKARLAYASAVKKVGSERLIEAARSYADDPERDGDYTKYPATWLNDECWDDEPTQVGPSVPKGFSAIQRSMERRNGEPAGKEQTRGLTA